MELIVSRRSVLSTTAKVALGVATLSSLSGCEDSYEKREASTVGATVFGKILGPGGPVVGAELFLTVPGYYIVEVFDTSARHIDRRNKSLRIEEFTVNATPHRQMLSDWEPSSSVLLHIALLDQKGKLKTEAVGLPKVLMVLS